ncbi:hypothetical protein HUJ05_012880 [Dendroctonus ponderosae]|nr:hypothetical protein HUJ05_012880 [Dendroctonus ponderosae]
MTPDVNDGAFARDSKSNGLNGRRELFVLLWSYFQRTFNGNTCGYKQNRHRNCRRHVGVGIAEKFASSKKDVLNQLLESVSIVQQHYTFTIFITSLKGFVFLRLVAHVLIIPVMKPQSVSILTKEKHVSAEKRYEVECRTSGSRPDAVITWWKGSRPVKRLAKNVLINYLPIFQSNTIGVYWIPIIYEAINSNLKYFITKQFKLASTDDFTPTWACS